MALPQLSEADRKKALEKAAQARAARAKLREDIRSGKIAVKKVLNSVDDPIVARLKVSTMIESLPGYGKAKAMKIMDELDIASNRRIKGLGVRQREALIDKLENR